jgi:hypothetical protein
LKSGQEWTDEKTADLIINWMPALLAKAAESGANPALSLFQVHPRGRAVIPDPLQVIADAGTSTRSPPNYFTL